MAIRTIVEVVVVVVPVVLAATEKVPKETCMVPHKVVATTATVNMGATKVLSKDMALEVLNL